MTVCFLVFDRHNHSLADFKELMGMVVVFFLDVLELFVFCEHIHGVERLVFFHVCNNIVDVFDFIAHVFIAFDDKTFCRKKKMGVFTEPPSL